MTALRRTLLCALLALGLLGASAGPALAHATLEGATPASGTATSPRASSR